MNPNDPTIEELLGELDGAARAGVFRRTYLNGGEVAPAGRSRPRPLVLRFQVWAPLSAAALLAIVVWSWMFSAKLSDVRARREARVPVLDRSTSVAEVFPSCMTGPGSDVSADCQPFDLDGDRDVDLVDFSLRQQVSQR